jgi:hypothetical protein
VAAKDAQLLQKGLALLNMPSYSAGPKYSGGFVGTFPGEHCIALRRDRAR